MCLLGICKRVGSGELGCVGWTSKVGDTYRIVSSENSVGGVGVGPSLQVEATI